MVKFASANDIKDAMSILNVITLIKYLVSYSLSVLIMENC